MGDLRSLAVEPLEDRRLLATGPFPVPLQAEAPLGSLIYHSSVSASIAASGEADSYTIDLDDDQTVTVVVDPGETLRPTIRLSDPDHTLIGSAEAGAPGTDAVLQVVPATGAGNYTVTVRGQSGTTGAYTVQVILNAAVEEEGHDGPANDDPASAQDLDVGFLAIGDGTAQRAAVLAMLPPPWETTVAGEDFESGVLGGQWTTYSSQAEGRVRVTGQHGTAGGSYALLMDRSPGGAYNLNEAIWTVDLSGLEHAKLSFSHAEFSEYTQSLPQQFTGHADGDGAAISDDGVRWYTVFTPPNQTDGAWVEYTVDLAAQAAAAGMTLGPDFQIKFQQFDFLELPDTGRGLDEIVITTPVATEDWYRFTLDDGQPATLALMELTPGDATLQLYDDDLELLATGVAAANVDQVINDYVDPTGNQQADVYFARVVRDLGSDYSLVVTRGGDFDTEPNHGLAPHAQQMTPSESVLGYLGFSRGELWTDPQKLTASDADANHNFGSTVSISGDTAIVGAIYDDQAGDSAGAAYIYQFDGTAWVEKQKLIASDAAAYEQFGRSVGISGDVAIVGQYTTHSMGDDLGSAYLYRYDGDRWVEEQKVVSSDQRPRDYFGSAVSISGESAIVGAYLDDDGGASSGSAYVFHFDGSRWHQQQKLTASDVTAYALFGNSVSISGDTAIVGAINDSEAADHAGAAYVFRYAGGQWIQQQKLLASDPGSDDRFGCSVSIDGRPLGGGLSQTTTDGWAIVGADDNDDAGRNSGAAYMFRFDGSRWVQHRKLLASDADIGDDFGCSVSISGTAAVVGARNDDDVLPGAGAAYIFNYDGRGWVEEKIAASDADTYDYFGRCVAVSGENLIVGSSSDDHGYDCGSAYVVNFSRLDHYAVGVRAGDLLAVSTATPGDGPGEFVNTLDPAVELYDPAGRLVAADDNSDPDGRNARLTHVAALPGDYTVRVRATGETVGEYALNVHGPTGGPTAFAATATDPAEGAVLASAPTQMTIELNDSLLLSTLEASDLTIDGVPAVAVNVIDGDTVVFDLPGLPDGLRQVAIAAGAILDLQGTPIEPFSGTFRIDSTPPRVVSSSLREGGVVAAGTLFYTARFDEQLDASNLDPADVELVGQLSGRPTPTQFHYDPTASVLTLEYADLPDDAYTLTLSSGDGRLEDLLGHDLDGERNPATTVPSGDGTPGGDFVVHFSADRRVAPWAVPLQAERPLGSLVYTSSATAVIGTYNDTDSYTIDLDDGQTVAVTVAPDEQLQPTIELLDPGGAVIGTATAGAPGKDALLQAVPTRGAGRYTVVVGSAADSTGRYTAGLILNAAVSEEAHDGPSNDEMASAEDLDSSFLPLGDGSAQRGAVLAGRGTIMISEDFESGTLDEQWTTYIEHRGGGHGTVQVTSDWGAAGGMFALLMDVTFGDGT